MDILIGIFVGLTIGGGSAWLTVSSKLKKEFQNESTELQIEVQVSRKEVDNLRQIKEEVIAQLEALKTEKNQEIESLRQHNQEAINGIKEQMTNTFKTLATDVLKQGNQEIKQQADEDLTRRQQSIIGVVQPIQDNLVKLEKEIRELEKERINSYHELRNQVGSLISTEKSLKQETSNLVKVLRQPNSRGQWGEVVLEKVLEMSGMSENIHYTKQQSVSTEDKIIRPDIIVNLPNGRNLVIDAKAVMSAYLNTMLDSPDDIEREKGYVDHASQLRSRINDLSKKEYYAQFQPCPEFVVLFLPAESLFSSALQFDSGLLEYAANKNIILATPTTLIALLRTVHYGWKQDEIAKNAREIGQIGNELYERFAKMIEHFNSVGKSIKDAGKAYDQTAASVNSRLIPSFKKLGTKVEKKENEIGEIEELDITLRLFQSSFLEIN
jgi:DNA recombination protein RmuC